MGWLRKNGGLFGFEGGSPDGKDINPGCLRGLDFFIGKNPIADASLHARHNHDCRQRIARLT